MEETSLRISRTIGRKEIDDLISTFDAIINTRSQRGPFLFSVAPKTKAGPTNSGQTLTQKGAFVPIEAPDGCFGLTGGSADILEKWNPKKVYRFITKSEMSIASHHNLEPSSRFSFFGSWFQFSLVFDFHSRVCCHKNIGMKRKAKRKAEVQITHQVVRDSMNWWFNPSIVRTIDFNVLSSQTSLVAIFLPQHSRKSKSPMRWLTSFKTMTIHFH